MTEAVPIARIQIHRDPLRPSNFDQYEVEAGGRLIDWLWETYPSGFGAPIVLHLNGVRLQIADADVILRPGDQVFVLVQPAGPLIGPALLASLITAAISAVASLVASLIFKPKGPNSHAMPAPDPIYSITGAQNAARLGDPVPAIYGQVVTVPDYASQPYVFFENNDQYIDQLLVIGQGDYVLGDILIGETPVSAMESNAVSSWLFTPDIHGEAMGAIEAASGIMENVVTSAEVGDQELTGLDPDHDPVYEVTADFTAPNTITFTPAIPIHGGSFYVDGSDHNDGAYTVASMTGGQILTVETTIIDEPGETVRLSFFTDGGGNIVGPFITSKPGANGNRIMLDFVWPGGLYMVDKDSGDIKRETVQFDIDYQLVADDGTPIGVYTTYPVSLTHATNTPQRVTYSIDVAPGRYRVRVVRLSPPAPNQRHINNFTWIALKFRLVPTVGAIYGPITMLGLRVRATNGIASGATSRVRAIVTRKLPPMGSGAAVASRSPADAFIDIYCNPIYGAKRPLGEVDLAEVARISASWDGQAKFDSAFAQKSTIWEGLSLALQTANAAPLPLGHIMSLAQEGVKATRRQLFSDANMTRGSLSIGYSFNKPGDPDGVRVEYRDPVTWNSLYVTYPAEADDPEQVTLFGCTDAVQAGQFAQLLWQKRVKLRKTATVDTELEGLLARLGDRIAISAELPRWGMSGVIVGASGSTLWLDQPADWSGAGHLIILRDERGQPSDPIAVTPGPEPATVILGAPAPFPLFGTGRQEPTHYAFGEAVQLVRDFTVQRIEPRGGALVGVEALAYDPAAFADSLPWLLEAT